MFYLGKHCSKLSNQTLITYRFYFFSSLLQYQVTLKVRNYVAHMIEHLVTSGEVWEGCGTFRVWGLAGGISPRGGPHGNSLLVPAGLLPPDCRCDIPGSTCLTAMDPPCLEPNTATDIPKWTGKTHEASTLHEELRHLRSAQRGRDDPPQGRALQLVIQYQIGQP